MAKPLKDEDIRVVVGLDFGTTYSGFTYCHVDDKQNYNTNDNWPELLGQFKTNTVLQYDDDLGQVEFWGFPALAKRPSRKKEKNLRRNVVELFKLHLGNLKPELRPQLVIDYKKAITDYLRLIGNWIKDETLEAHWNGIKFENILFVLTVPAEYSEKAIFTMRECACDAGLIDVLHSKRLQFTTEPEAAAIYCMGNLKEHNLDDRGTTFMIVDCGGGTVDLTTRKLLNIKQLGEVTERTGDYCGSTFIDKAFKTYLRRKLGSNAMDLLEENQYGQLQYMVQEFCEHAKLPFTGDDPDFYYEMDLDEVCPILLQYVSEEVKEKLEEDENLIKFDFETIKSMFDPIIERIINMIKMQLDNSREKRSVPSIMFLVGGFSESKYLQKRIKEEFQDQVDNISVPPSPTAAISRGAAIYGLDFSEDKSISKSIIGSRVLKHTYGINVLRPWVRGDPTDKIVPSIFYGVAILGFHCIAKRGTVAKIDDEFPTEEFSVSPSHPFQTAGVFEIYYTREFEGEFSHDPGMKLLGKLKIDWPDVQFGLERSISFKLAFGKMEITATAKNDLTGQNYHTFFEIDVEDK
ncbi:hypothetical protein C1645_809790 [Glomus cerebriforme]|uniref:Actin-like ATPase domain-containing protein n=1 Tax=Glomus cerebriforme TaxID=658196 RepID=A0A397SBF5_9GLOM|nr:hypothetical protein C1645_809790 [Glomus cerebriforme]